ncbi:molybdate ABC transporter substrate-binding protein [Bacillus aerolatus]|uniref:Molybdate ABC transporter substrate-binding protein n=1 Tax=Bacillus aerolatus TaxID=2653354 RepID=A0A6I1FMN8_9BACI|nr:molybdate ABC transporter substrate-binding protein [Bacillus aerolatus]KAB7707569.1 molybdate ABC transporter substrate-binding protein [Bacillus aerolatus]
MRNRMLIVYICASLLFLNACTSANEKEKAQGTNGKLTVAAASDLQLAFTEMAKEFEEKMDTEVELTFGSTGTLVQQIENGAPYDVFAAANVRFVDGLKEKGKTIPETQKIYSRGKIGIAALKEKQLEVANLQDLMKPEVKKIAIANPEHAPYGMAAKEALESAGLWDNIEEKLVYGKSISDTLTIVATGNAEAGIIAHSIVTDEVNFSPVNEQLHGPINQAITVIKGTDQEKLAKEFVQYVTSKEGTEILKKYGFSIPEGG